MVETPYLHQVKTSYRVLLFSLLVNKYYGQHLQAAFCHRCMDEVEKRKNQFLPYLCKL